MTGASVALGEDSVLPFVIGSAGVRGRLVRLGPALQEILSRHDYPLPVARLLAEFLLLAGALSSMMKYQGVFTLQTRGDGPLRFIVADVSSSGALRGYVEMDRPAIEALLAKEPKPSLPRLCGSGHLTFTVDRNDEGQRYQGIVELTGASLADCVFALLPAERAAAERDSFGNVRRKQKDGGPAASSFSACRPASTAASIQTSWKRAKRAGGGQPS